MKHKQRRTIRGHVGYLCKLEGGKSQAKIHDAIQILNHHYDVVLEGMIEKNITESDIHYLAIGKSNLCFEDVEDIFFQAAAKRWLKKNKQTKRSKQK